MKETDREIQEYFHQIFSVQGLDSSTANIFAVLFMEPEPIAMDDLAEKTGYCLASISNKIKLFEPIGMIKKSRKPGSKKIYLFMEKDFLKSVKNGIKLKQEAVISLAKAKLPMIINKYRKKAKTDIDKQKTRIIENYYKQVKQFEEILGEALIKIDKLENGE